MNINRQLTIIAALVIAVASTALTQQNQADLKQRVLTQAQAVGADDYAFTRTVRSEQTSNGKTEQKVNIEKFDPTKPADLRWTLVSVDGAPPSADALSKYRKESAKRRVPGYFRLANYFAAPMTTATDSRGRTVFRFASLPKDSVLVFNSDVSQNTSAEASLGEANGVPFVEQVHLTVKPMRLKLLMKLEHFESTNRYRIGPDGKPILIEQTSDMSGSGMGQEGKAHTVVTYSDYRAVK